MGLKDASLCAGKGRSIWCLIVSMVSVRVLGEFIVLLLITLIDRIPNRLKVTELEVVLYVYKLLYICMKGKNKYEMKLLLKWCLGASNES